MSTENIVAEGLKGVVIGKSEICFIDGKRGKLIYRGYDIHDLVNHSNFEEVVYLLWYGKLPTKKNFDDLYKSLVTNRALSKEAISLLKSFPKKATPMEVLRTAISTLSLTDHSADDTSFEANVKKGINLTAKTATIIAAFDRMRNGKEPIEPSPNLNHAANFLYMLTGKVPDEMISRFFDICLILHADHELNASTFAARVTSSTLSDLYSAITSAVGTLKGPLHGGANIEVMKMLIDMGTVDKTKDYVRTRLAERKRIMGFGHRVYKTEDPRATHLRRMSKEMGEKTGLTKWYEMSRVIEDLMLNEKGMYPNVDFYSASAYYTMGIPIDLYTPIFALSRVSGWIAHVLEQYSNNTLIRPIAEYVGPNDLTYVPIDKR
ncbi:MAG: 2-methylcitrate synthase/citrate synthase II, citrate synthase [Candidatus Dadabacteria bacterium CSP1-2]|nr:MAG: 2-methylcitrate synthase/citrate synthase II, citrate synthase [Candidatus Dadabacteria bacterium CSP1-2]